MIKTSLEEPVCKNGYVLDRFPRTIEQVTFLDEYVRSNGTHLDRIMVLEVPLEEILRRAVVRRKDEDRIDDRANESLPDRLARYQRQTIPAINYFEVQGIVSHIDGTLTIPQFPKTFLDYPIQVLKAHDG